MKYLALIWIAAVCGLIYLYSSLPSYQEPVVPANVDAKLWRRGRVMYKARCTTCHNSNPDLAGSVGPKLRGVSEELLRERLANGKGAMPPQKSALRFATAFREYLK